MRHVSPFHRYGVLHGLLESKLHVQAFKDRVVLTPFLSFSVQTSAIVAAVDGMADIMGDGWSENTWTGSSATVSFNFAMTNGITSIIFILENN